MNTSDRLDLQLQPLTGLRQPVRAPDAEPFFTSSTLSGILGILPPIPPMTILLGVANDGLPVLLNLKDPVPGPVLITGDPKSGKTRLLQVISQFVEQRREPDNLRYSVITSRASEWEGCDHSSSCEGILPLHHSLTSNYLQSLVDWAHSSKQDRQYVILLIDGLEDLAGDSELHQAFSWLLLRGQARHIWPIVTLSAAQAETVEPWLAAFRTRLFGHIQGQQSHRGFSLLTGGSGFSFNYLLAPTQFAMRNGDDWLHFWLPDLD